MPISTCNFMVNHSVAHTTAWFTRAQLQKTDALSTRDDERFMKLRTFWSISSFIPVIHISCGFASPGVFSVGDLGF